jgi:hypothetical protein
MSINCEKCQTIIQENDPKYLDPNDKQVCLNCFDDNYQTCEDCESVFYQEDMTYINDTAYCEGCRENDHFCCYHCEEWCHTDNRYVDSDNNDYCEYCRDNGYGNFDEDDQDGLQTRKVSQNDKYKSTKHGNIIKTIRGFAVEIECYCQDYDSQNDLAESTLSCDLGISYDGSLGDNGVEFQTPILKGKTGEDFIKNLCSTLNRNDYYTDKTCGLHLHIDGSKSFTGEDKLKNCKRLFTTYYYVEPVLMMFLPFSRRNNHYCKILQNDYNIAEIRNAETQEKLEQIWYRQDDLKIIDEIKKTKNSNTRYHGFNFHCLLWDNHLELRYHSGTIDKNKILFWAEMNLSLMKWAIGKDYNEEMLKTIQNITDPKTKREMLYKMLKWDLNDDIVGYFESRAKKFCVNELTSDNTENK